MAPTHLTRLGFALYAGARLPGLSMVEGSGEAGVRLWVADGSGSAAVADADGSVTVYGPRDVWKDVEAMWAEYERLGRPSDRDMGITVTPCGQRVWVRSAEHEVSAAW
ncbi:hypothetical protein ACFV3R_04385 [Streptomyces sp. NPDC059740]|uniref:hypothetical protein n=1 Tax=Streptomyces sp. NPDC059740 TaxID=3346926 RepID=UPI003668DC99